MNYNLLDESWIPVLYRNGNWDRVGIRTALLKAEQIHEIAASNPMDRVAVLRFLIALMYWCNSNPNEDKTFADNCISKLTANARLFDVLGQGTRFYQDPEASRNRPATDLLQEIPAGNNFWHFRHSTDYENGLCLPCCVLGLLRLPLFSVSGLPDLKAGINGTPPIYAIPLGHTLLDTLSSNWNDSQKIGIPTWELPNTPPVLDNDIPLLLGLTLLSRRVWLHTPQYSQSQCVCCGTKSVPLVFSCEFQSAGNQKSEQWRDPHVIYSIDAPGKSSSARDLSAAGTFRMDRPWPHLISNLLIAMQGESDKRSTTLLVVGFATDKAKNIDVWERRIPVAALPQSAERNAKSILRWHKEGALLEKRIGRSGVEGSALLASIRPHVEHEVSNNITIIANGSDDLWAKAVQEYQPLMRPIAQSLSPGFTTKAVARRIQIEQVSPHMQDRTDGDKKQKRKKGGDK